MTQLLFNLSHFATLMGNELEITITIHAFFSRKTCNWWNCIECVLTLTRATGYLVIDIVTQRVLVLGV